jgi:uncharacterized protein YciI
VKSLAVIVLLALLAPAVTRCVADPGSGTPELRYLVFLRPDPARKPATLEERQRIMDAHMANINQMAKDGVLFAAGPMDDTPVTISGIFVLKCDSLAAAEKVAAQDPTVVAKRNMVDVRPWLGPAGIGTNYFRWKKENPDAKDVMASHAFCLIKRGPAWAVGSRTYDDDGSIDALRRAGLLSAAGEIDGDPELVGLVIFKTASVDEARKSLAEIPSVKAGRLAVEYHVWWTADRILPW